MSLPQEAKLKRSLVTVIEGPRLQVLSRPNFTEEFREFLSLYGQVWKQSELSTPAERLVEFAGRVCYMSFSRPAPRNTTEYIRHLIIQGHESVLEHAVWSFVLSGVSRAFTHQLVRHRVGFSYSQLSQQYHDEEDAQFVVPPEIQNNPKALAIWETVVASAKEAYRTLSSNLAASAKHPKGTKMHRESARALRSAARSVLPNATATAIVVTANARALRHFFRNRGSIVGDLEMRRVASLIFSNLVADAPALFQDFDVREHEDGWPIMHHRASHDVSK
jgi:thymidylate synthase (FAD)